ncbi:MAG: tetratricopeptide repeat protein [Candidatus Wallacebacter cryptica]
MRNTYVWARRKLEQAEKILSLSAERELTMQELNLVLELLEEIKRHHPDLFQGENTYLWEELAFAYYNLHHIGRAERCLRVLAELIPDSSEPFINLGAFFLNEGLIDRAINAYLEGLAVNPDDEYLCFNLASLYASIGAYRKADSVMNKAVLANPTRALTHMLKGDIAAERGLFELAAHSYEHALELMEDDCWIEMRRNCYFKLAAALMHLGHYERCILTIEKLITVYFDCCSDVYLILARCYQKLGNPDLTRWYAKKAEQQYRLENSSLRE